MTNAGMNRFHIPLDESGAIVNIFQWPWYWRYSLAVAGLSVCMWLAVEMAGGASPDTRWMIILGIAAVLCSLLAFELLLLGFFIGLIYGFVKLVTLIFPNTNSLGWLPTLGVFASVAACWALFDLIGTLDEVKKSNALLNYKVDELARQIERSTEQLYDKLTATEDASSDHWCE